MANTKDRVVALLASKAVSELKKKFGDTILEKASDFKYQAVPRIPTGIFTLDAAMGGGFAVGAVNTAYGPKSGGKTTAMLKAIGNAQKMCMGCYHPAHEGTKCFFCECENHRDAVAALIDVEGSYDKEWAESNGVDDTRLIISAPDFAEQAIDVADALLRSGKLDILMIDSLAQLSVLKEIEESAEKGMVGEQARLLGRAMRKFQAAINLVGNSEGRRPTIFLVNQIRHKVGVFFGNPETVSGGFAPGFAAKLEVRFSSGSFEMDESTKKEELQEPLWVDVKFKVEKNKTYRPKISGEYRMLLADADGRKKGDVLDEEVVIKYAEKNGLLVEEGTWKILGIEFGSKAEVAGRMISDRNFKWMVMKALFSVMA